VLHIDDFGNIITNISAEHLSEIGVKEGDHLSIRLNNKSVRLKHCSTYGKVKVNELLTLIGGHGFLEIAMNQSSAAKKLNARKETRIRIRSV
jgi:hypothetical protein